MHTRKHSRPRPALIGDQGKEWFKGIGHAALACATFVVLWGAACHGREMLRLAKILAGH